MHSTAELDAGRSPRNYLQSVADSTPSVPEQTTLFSRERLDSLSDRQLCDHRCCPFTDIVHSGDAGGEEL